MAYSPIERLGIHAIGLIVTEELNWIFREQPIEDWGIDAEIEVVDDGVPTGRLIAVQIKAGESYFNEEIKDGFVYRGTQRHLAYWQGYSLPVVLILYNPNTKSAYWELVREGVIEHTGLGWKIVIPKANQLEKASAAALRKIAIPDLDLPRNLNPYESATNKVSTQDTHTFPTQKIKVAHYLESLIALLSELPAYYERDFSFEHIRQRVRISQRRLTHLDFQRKEEEAERRSGYFAEDEEQVRGYLLRGAEMYLERDSGATTVVDWGEVREELHRGIILGDPGFGKTWLLKYEGVRIAKEQLQMLSRDEKRPDEVILPIFLRLGTVANQLMDAETNIQHVITRLVAKSSTLAPSWIAAQLNKGRCLLLLDALDEVDINLRPRLVDALTELERTTQSRILLTSRIVGYRRPFALQENDQEREVEIVAFDMEQIKSFVESWFVHTPQLGVLLIDKLKREPALHGLVRIPILLSFICLLAREDRPLPTRRVQLYETLLSHLLEGRWREESLQERNPERLEAKLLLLEEIAWHFAAETRNGQWHDLMKGDELSQVILDSRYSNFVRESAPHPYGILWELSEKDGVIVKTGATSGESERQIPYLFLHRTFHEYLVASYLARLEIEQWSEVVKKHCWYDADWEEVIVLLAGRLPDYQPLVTKLLSEENDVFNKMLILATRCFTEVRFEGCPEDIKEDIIKELLGLLRSKSLSEKRQARRALVMIGNTQVVSGLLETYNKDSSERPSIMDDLIEIDTKQALVFFREALASQEPHARKLAVMGLEKIDDEEAKALLLKCLDDSDLEVRVEAAQAVGDPNNEKVMSALKEGLWLDDSLHRSVLIHKIGAMGGPSAVTLLKEILGCPDKYTRYYAVEELAKIGGEQATGILQEALNDRHVDVRIRVAKVLSHQGNHKAFAVLKAAINYNHLLLQIEALALHIQVDEARIESIVRHLSEDKDALRHAFISSELYGGEYAFSFLFDCLKHDSNCVRWIAARLLCEISSTQMAGDLRRAVMRKHGYQEGKKALINYAFAITLNTRNSRKFFKRVIKYIALLGLIKKAITTIDIEAKEMEAAIAEFGGQLSAPGDVIRALGGINNEQAVDILIEAFETPFGDFRKNVIEALSSNANEKAYQGLIMGLSDEVVDVRIASAKALKDKPNEQVFAVLSDALDEREARLRERAVRALGEIGGERAEEILRKALSDQEKDVRTEAAKILRKAGGKRAIKILEEELLQRDWPWWSNNMAADALGEIGDEQAVAALLRGLNSHRGAYGNAAMVLAKVAKGQVAVRVWSHTLQIWPKFNLFKEERFYDLLSSLAPEVCKSTGDEWPFWRAKLMSRVKPPPGVVVKTIIIFLRITLWIPIRLLNKKKKLASNLSD